MNKLSQEEVVHRIKALHPTLEVTGTYVNQTTPIEVRCTTCGHTWETLPEVLFRSNSGTCRKCASKVPTDKATARLAEARAKFPDISFPATVKTVHEAFDAHCTVCDHQWTTSLSQILDTRGCPKCTRRQTSTTEQFLFETVRLALHPEKVRCRDRAAIGRELDIYVPDRAKAIEFGAWYWHKNKVDDDIAKERLCEKAGIELLTIYEDAHDTGLELPKRSLCLTGHVTSLKDLTALGKRVLAFIEPNDKDRARNLNWERIYETAKKRTDRKAILKNFATQMANIHPDIEVRGRYVRSNTPIEVRCTVCGHVWKATPSGLLEGHGCPQCAHRNAKLQQRATAAAAFTDRLRQLNPDLELISEYTTRTQPAHLHCRACGTEWWQTPRSALEHPHCPNCSRLETIQMRLRQAGSSLEVTGPYQGQNAPLACHCEKCGHIFKRTPKNLRENPRCPICHPHRSACRLTDTEFKARMAKTNPRITIIGVYKKRNEKLECACNVCGHHWMATPDGLLRGTGCPECARRNSLKRLETAARAKHTTARISFETKMSKANPDITVVGTYTESKAKLECKCNVCGHHWMATPNSLLRGSGCPNCANKKRGAAMAAARAAKRATNITQNPNDAPQSGRGNTSDDSPGKETSCP